MAQLDAWNLLAIRVREQNGRCDERLLPRSVVDADLVLPVHVLRSDLAVLERYANPNALVKMGVKRLAKIIAKASANQHGTDRAAEWITAAESALELYRDHPAVAFDAIAEEIATEVRLLRAVETERARHAAAREDRYMVVDPDQLARSIPGFSTIGGPALVACMGDPARFAKGKQFRSFSGLTPKASETGNTDRKGQAISKAGSSLLRTRPPLSGRVLADDPRKTSVPQSGSHRRERAAARPYCGARYSRRRDGFRPVRDPAIFLSTGAR